MTVATADTVLSLSRTATSDHDGSDDGVPCPDAFVAYAAAYAGSSGADSAAVPGSRAVSGASAVVGPSAASAASGAEPGDAGGGRPEPLSAGVMADIARGIAAARPLWGAVVHHDPDHRQPVRLLATDHYEVWVIGWTAGQGVRLHDHGPSAGTFVVTSGELTEVLPHGRGLVERRLGAGRLRHVPVGALHDVVNRGRAPATSIHVYSPPMETMTYYDPETRLPVETEHVAPEDPLLAGRAASFLLHPASRG